MRAVVYFCLLFLLTGCVSQIALTGPQSRVMANMDSLLDKTGPSYFTVLVHQRDNPDEGPETGSGFVVSTKGHVLTAGHVGGRVGNKVEVRGIDQIIYHGKVVAVSKLPDMALLKLENFKGKPVRAPVKPVEQSCIKQGTPMFSIGNPKFGNNTVRIGTLVSMHHRPFVSSRGFGYSDAMQISLDTQVGESGGPVFSEHGRLAGMIVSGSNQKGLVLSITQAIPAFQLARFVCARITCPAPWKRLAVRGNQQCDG